jgi:hypothetical protein
MTHTSPAGDDADIIDAMLRFGGGFIQQLARLYRQADLVNRGRLRDAFPDYWESYRQMAITAESEDSQS